MPDSNAGRMPTEDRRTGAGGLSTGVSPLIADKSKFWFSNNMIFDFPGFASSRRGLQDLDRANHYSALSGLSTSYLPRRAWCFDNHLFLYLEDSTHGAIAAYDMIGGSWQIVQAAGSKLEMDSATKRVAAKAFDRTMLVLTNAGAYRLSSIYASSGASAFTYANAFRPAGVPRALDPRCRNALASSGTDHGFVATPNYNWLTDPTAATIGQASVGYRVCFVYRDENGILISGAPSGRIVVRNTTGTAYSVRLKVPIPAGLTGRYVMQVYRTNVMPKDGTGSIPDPGDDHFLAGEYMLSSTDLANGYALFLDISFDGILGDELYTNSDQDGPDQARFQPPVSRAIERFGNCSWFGNVTDRQRLTMRILAVDSSGLNPGTFPGIAVGDKITAGGLTMEAATPANEEAQDWYFAADETTGSGGEIIRCLKTTESFVYKYNLLSNKNNGRYAAYNLTSNDDIVGVIGFEEKAVGGPVKCFLSTSRLDSPTSILPVPSIAPNTLTDFPSTFTTNVAGTQCSFTLAASTWIVTAGDRVFVSPYGLNISPGAGSSMFKNTHVPAGEYTVLSFAFGVVTIDVTGTGAIGSQTETIDATHGCASFPTFISAQGLSSNAVSQSPVIKNRLYWSAPGEFECAPIVNFKDLGSADSAIQAIVSTVSSLFVFKEDGLWRARGTDGNWEFEYVDQACRCIAPYSPAVVLGDVYCYTSNGVVRITEGGVTKVSTEIGNLTDTFQRGYASNPAQAIWVEGVGHDEDQAYMLSFPATATSQGAGLVYRYHIPSKSWGRHTYNDNAGAAGTGTIGSMCMVRATRYDAAAGTQAYINRLVVAHNSAANSIGIERRGGTFQDYCDFDVGYQTISSYNTNTSVIALAAPPPVGVRVGDIIWARNASSPDVTYRAPITAINGALITISQAGAIATLSSWPAPGTVQAVFMTQISKAIAYTPTTARSGFSTTHMSDVTWLVGNNARYTDILVEFATDMNFVFPSITTTGFAAGAWTALASGLCQSSTMANLVSMSSIVPQDAQRAGVSFVTLVHGHAWEPFDLAGFQVSTFGESKTRRMAV